MSFKDIQQRDQAAVMHTYARFPVGMQSGKGATCIDFDGKTYIDFTAGIGVNSLGFCDDGWIAAVTEQLGTLQHMCNLYYTEPCIKAAEMIKARSGLEKVFFGNSGAEANEGAIKAARKYSYSNYGPGRSAIVTLQNSFHGRTVTTLAATGQDVFHKDFYPFTEGFVYAQPNDIADTLAKLDDTVCAVMLELIQGEGGVTTLDEAYVASVVAACHEKDILVIADEVQTGIGRTGSFFCYQQYGFLPDIVTFAKGIGGGLPLGGILFGKKTEEALLPGDHASTFGGNPIACAGAVEVLSHMDEAFYKAVQEKGAYMKSKLETMPHVVQVDGKGLMLGIQLEGVTNKEVVEKANEIGVLTLTAGQKVRLLPPLTITYEEMGEGLARLKRALGEFEGGKSL